MRKRKKARKPKAVQVIERYRVPVEPMTSADREAGFERIPDPIGEMVNGREFKVRMLLRDGRTKRIEVMAENEDEAKAYARLHLLMHNSEQPLARGGVVVVT